MMLLLEFMRKFVSIWTYFVCATRNKRKKKESIFPGQLYMFFDIIRTFGHTDFFFVSFVEKAITAQMLHFFFLF